MIRSPWVATAVLLWFGAAVAAQPPGEAPTAAVLASNARPAFRSPVEDQNVKASNRQPASSFDELRLLVAVGDTVQVIDARGQETRGRVAALSELELTLAVDGTRRVFVVGGVKRIDRRRRDSVLNGLLIGASVGALMGLGVGRTVDSPACPRSGSECGQGAIVGTVGGAVWGAVGGWIVDALIRKRQTIYAPPGPK